MSKAHIARIMHDFLYREVERNELLQFDRQQEFFVANSKPYAVNLLAFALGQIPQNLVDFSQFQRSDLVTDRKLRDSLTDLVNRMPSLEFQLIPLVLLLGDRLEVSCMLRVRKASNSTQCVYLDLTNRMYEDFGEFLANNKLPTCKIWYPTDGLLQYDPRTPASPVLMIDTREITCNTGVVRGIMVAGSTLATLLAFTPLSATVTVPLIFATSVANSGFSLTDLVDSCKYEKGTVVARRAVALGLNLTTFASTGLTLLCRTEKLRRLLPAEKLLRLETAERFLAGTMRNVATGSTIVAVIGTVGGWQTLPTAEWIELATLLCFAYREHFNQANALRLFDMMQWNGAFKFFKQCCPNVPHDILRSKLEGPTFDRFLELAMSFLKNNVNFTVDNSFIKIYLFGYELEFDVIFKIKWEHLKSLLLFLQTSKSTYSNSNKAALWTQPELTDILKLLEIVSKIRNYFCTLSDYITLGHGHRFSMATVRAFLTAKKLNRKCLLDKLAALSHEQTEVLNALRDSGRISGGDVELFNWLGNHDSGSYYSALCALISVAEAQQKIPSQQSIPITFTDQRIGVSALLGFNAVDFLLVPVSARTILLSDDRFLRLCFDANESLLARANKAWMRTCCSETAIQYLETIGLLEQLFERVGTTSGGPPPSLASALDYALYFEDTNVSQVYYSIVSAWKQFTVPLDKRKLQTRFLQLMNDALSLAMAWFYHFAVPDNEELAANDEKVIKYTRTALLKLVDIENAECSIPFGPLERAACWLGMLPILRNKASHRRMIQMLMPLVANGTGSVLQTNDSNLLSKRMVMFVKDNDKVLIEAIIPSPGDTNLRVSFYMCGSTIRDWC